MRTTVLTAIGVTLAMGWHIGMAQVVAPTQPLNDTGMRKCLNTATNTFSLLCQGPNIPPGQDGKYGRDKTTPTAVDGVLGFSFTKVCRNGELAGTGNCPANPVYGSQFNNWGCTKDNVTGLIWEIKTHRGWRGRNKTYTNLGNGAATDASGFVNAVNASTLCGASDWRLPTVTELQSIVNYSTAKIVGVNWFQNSLPIWYWTSEGQAGDASYAWFVSFNTGSVNHVNRDGYYAVRLVRASQ